jgi:hypothetical protein
MMMQDARDHSGFVRRGVAEIAYRRCFVQFHPPKIPATAEERQRPSSAKRRYPAEQVVHMARWRCAAMVAQVLQELVAREL